MFGVLGILIGIVLGAIGVFLIFGFPANPEHQPKNFSIIGVIIGFILAITAGLLIFLP